MTSDKDPAEESAKGLDPAAVEAWVVASRARQGLGPKITDPATWRRSPCWPTSTPSRGTMTLGRVLWIGWCTLWAVFWITLGWLFLPGINVFLFILSLVLMIPAMINTRR
jgi:hypothetical protein